jgi:hypothetical protein
MRSTRFLSLPILAAAALGGCSMQTLEMRAAYEPVTDVSATSATPMAALSPSAGEVVSVLQSRSDGILTQRIVLRGDPQTQGENHIIVKVDQSDRRSTGVDGPAGKPSESMIASELAEQFSGADMGLSRTYNRNSFGPFGYAIGHPSSAVTCIYAWQWQGPKMLKLVPSPDDLAATASLPSEQTSVRVRLCKAKMGEQEIVAILKDMTVFSPGSSEAYQDPSMPIGAPVGSDALAAAGIAGGVAPAAKETVVVDRTEPRDRKRRPKREARRHHRHHDDDEIGTEDAAPRKSDGPVVNVPLPGGGTTATAAPASSTSNPLLAPLQTAAPAPRAATSGSDMPLPPRGSASVRASAPAAEVAPKYAPIPLPN